MEFVIFDASVLSKRKRRVLVNNEMYSFEVIFKMKIKNK
jgi:hypothetical protein